MRWGVVSSLVAMAAVIGHAVGPATGLAASETSAKPLPSGPSDRRSAAPEARFIRDAQKTLRDLGYPAGPVDGIVGPRTRAALTRYQRAEGIPVTGRLDTETMARLDIHERLFRPVRQDLTHSSPARTSFGASAGARHFASTRT